MVHASSDSSSSNDVKTSQKSKQGVHVTIQDVDGATLGSFEANDRDSFFQMAQESGLELPVSCCSGACFVCACKIIQGGKCIDQGKLSVPLVDVEEDQVLTCVGGVMESCFDGGYHSIVLQKLL